MPSCDRLCYLFQQVCFDDRFDWLGIYAFKEIGQGHLSADELGQAPENLALGLLSPGDVDPASDCMASMAAMATASLAVSLSAKSLRYSTHSWRVIDSFSAIGFALFSPGGPESKRIVSSSTHSARPCLTRCLARFGYVGCNGFE